MSDLLGARTSPLEHCDQTTFRVDHAGTSVPAVVWRPRGTSHPPVVLLGHGGGDHKLTGRHVHFAEWFARHSGAACLAIDAPWHGERAVPGEKRDEFHSRMIAAGPARTQHQVADEWLAALDTLDAAGIVHGGRVAYIGRSLGSIFGFPTCAALGNRLVAAALGKVGTTCASHLHDIASPEVMARSASRVTAPVLFQMRWDDEIFPRQRQLDLFDLIASPRKVLRGHPGLHGDTWPEDETAWLTFIHDNLVAADRSTGTPPKSPCPSGEIV